jgi:Predicted membrane protein (DUF2154).
MKTKNRLWGIFFILGGLAVVINQLGVFPYVNMLNLIITIILVPIIIKSLFKGHFFGIFFPVAALGIMYAKELNITDLVPWPILITALFLSIGFTMIFHKNGSKGNCGTHCNYENFDEIIDIEDDSIVNVNVNFGSSIKYVNSNNFKKGSFNCTFGGLKVYFDNTTLDKDGATININASFSGIELYVPKNWQVVFSANTNLAGIEEKNRSNPDGINILTITGDINLAGVEIIYI